MNDKDSYKVLHPTIEHTDIPKIPKKIAKNKIAKNRKPKYKGAKNKRVKTKKVKNKIVKKIPEKIPDGAETKVISYKNCAL